MTAINMNDRPIVLKILAAPIAFFYWIGVSIRNWMFDAGLLHSQKFEQVTVISIGNITMGGTGKTPFTEYLVRLLMPDSVVAVLSRGFKRKTHGYLLATSQSTPAEIGDEPYQMKHKFPQVTVAVDANRCRGIMHVMHDVQPMPNVFVLDDAFQHRYVAPDIAILLVDYNSLITKDALFPIGMLREPLKAKNRANVVVVTKCPPDIKPIDLRILTKEMNLYPFQSLYFTTIVYGALTPLFDGTPALSPDELRNCDVLALSGIAKPMPFEQYVLSLCHKMQPARFSDHHNFSSRNYASILKKLDVLTAPHKVVITTEKDAVRLKNDPAIPEKLKNSLYYIPLTIKFIDNGDTFDNKIREYVDKNRSYVRISEE